MRALLGMVLFSMVGCDTLWASYVGMGDFGTDTADAGMSCSVTDGCFDLADAPSPDLRLPGCSDNSMCEAASSCDRNTGMCTKDPLPTEAFPEASDYVASIALQKRYAVMAAGDFNGDGYTDVAVSGVFSGGNNNINSTTAAVVDVDIYRGNGTGGLVFDGTCVVNDRVVHLLTVPVKNKPDDLLVAATSTKVHHCTRNGANWIRSDVGTIAGTGFRQLALANHENGTFPDLVVRSSDTYLPRGDGMSGRLDVYRLANDYTIINGTATKPSTSSISWITSTPYHFPMTVATYVAAVPANTADTIALSWDSKTAVNFQYVDDSYNVKDQGLVATVMQPPGALIENPGVVNRSTALFRGKGANPLALIGVASGNPNWISYQTGTSIADFKPITQLSLSLLGFMVPYAGDANNDRQDEVGIYTMSSAPVTRHLQLLLCSTSGVINTGAPLVDIATGSENFRGMALGNLAALDSRQRAANRKDLIALVEDPGTVSRLLVRRPNLNFTTF